MKVKRAKSSYVLFVGLLMLLVTGSYLAYSVYSAFSKTQVSEQQKVDTLPLVGILNQNSVKNLEKRRRFGSLELENVVSLDYSLDKTQKKTGTSSAIVEVQVTR